MAFAGMTTLYGVPCDVHHPDSELSKALCQFGLRSVREWL